MREYQDVNVFCVVFFIRTDSFYVFDIQLLTKSTFICSALKHPYLAMSNIFTYFAKYYIAIK